MTTRNIIDLSQPITPASPAPCDPPVEFRTVASHSPDSPYQMMWFGMTDHTGTHIDAPLHFVPGGKPIDEADLSACIPCPASSSTSPPYPASTRSMRATWNAS